MKEILEEIKIKGLEKIENAKTLVELEEVKKDLTGKKSIFFTTYIILSIYFKTKGSKSFV